MLRGFSKGNAAMSPSSASMLCTRSVASASDAAGKLPGVSSPPARPDLVGAQARDLPAHRLDGQSQEIGHIGAGERKIEADSRPALCAYHSILMAGPSWLADQLRSCRSNSWRPMPERA